MKKIVLLLLIAVMEIAGVSYASEPATASKSGGTVILMRDAAPLLSFVKNKSLFEKKIARTFESERCSAKSDPSIEQNYHSDDIPLTYEEQDWLQAACKEFNIPYALALGLIEKETTFRNIFDDDGVSAGYMQIQQKWHWDRMERLGVTDLMEPSGNFRVGCDFLAELYAKYNDWSLALTVYNFGHDPGYITDYAKDVMANYARWQEVINDYI